MALHNRKGKVNSNADSFESCGAKDGMLPPNIISYFPKAAKWLLRDNLNLPTP